MYVSQGLETQLGFKRKWNQFLEDYQEQKKLLSPHCLSFSCLPLPVVTCALVSVSLSVHGFFLSLLLLLHFFLLFFSTPPPFLPPLSADQLSQLYYTWSK